MKKLVSLVLATVMCLSMVACGGVDKQPAIDAFNSANTAFTELATAMNENIDLYSDEFVEVMMGMSDSLAQCKELLESDTELTEETVADLVTQLNDIEAWVADATGLAEEEAAAAVEGEVEAEVSVDMDAAIEYFNSVSTAFDAIATEVNNNPDAYTEEFIDQMIGISEGLTECKAGLEAGAELTEEEYADFIEVLGQVEEWLLAVESEVFG
ncbi:MAG: hypothetical protein IJB84_00755 [Lachnospiraceae bacterium]|nr:hypothetical protein [Lachnospiraceae bacterium]